MAGLELNGLGTPVGDGDRIGPEEMACWGDERSARKRGITETSMSRVTVTYMLVLRPGSADLEGPPRNPMDGKCRFEVRKHLRQAA